MILIIGTGHLGKILAEQLKVVSDEVIVATYNNNKPEIKGVSLVHCDVTEPDDLDRLAEATGGEELTVFYFASTHNIDECKENREETKKVNVDGLKNFFRMIPNIKRFFYASTDCVYGESVNGQVFTEDSVLTPINEYGWQKIEAEKIVLEHGGNILRFSLLLGEKSGIVQQIKDALFFKKDIELMSDATRPALSYYTAVGILLRLMKKDELPRIINVCADESLSKYDIGKNLAKMLFMSDENLVPVSFADLKIFSERRAKVIMMDNSLLKSILGEEKITSGII